MKTILPSRLTLLLSAALLIVGCSTHNTTLVQPEKGNGQLIYAISEAQAFMIALEAYAEVLPKQSVFDIYGPRRGYRATWRVAIDTYSQEVRIVPVIGTDASGREVQGYWFDVYGSGTALISGAVKNRALYRRIQEALDATGTGTMVTNVRDGRYETDGSAYRAQGKDGSEAAPAVRSVKPAATSAADKLRELQTMYDGGLITKEEFEVKRRQLLDRM